MEKKLQIELNDITQIYDRRIILDHLNLKVYTHEFIGIIGANGSGKTTLLKIILGLLPPSCGNIRYYQNGSPVSQIRMGYLPQYNKIDKDFPISVYEVILSGLSREKPLFRRYTPAHHERVRNTIQEMGLEGMEQQEVGKLSGGELQRTLLGRAIVSNPEVLILDEPTTYMDHTFEGKLHDLLENIRHKRTILLVSHNLNEVRQQADRVFSL